MSDDAYREALKRAGIRPATKPLRRDRQVAKTIPWWKRWYVRILNRRAALEAEKERVG